MIIPVSVHDVNQKEFLINWEDGARMLIPYRFLRFQCPCATCVDEHTGKRMITIDSIREDVYALEFKQVGNYALQFRWSDGHTTGIYAFDFLRNLEIPAP